MIEKKKAKNTTTWMIVTRGWKSNLPSTALSPDPEPKNKRASGRANCNGIKKDRLCPVFRPAMIPKAQPGNKLAEGNHWVSKI